MTSVAAALLFTTITPSTDRTLTICIDPGHPSEVGRGTHGRHVSEIHIAWIVAKRLEAILVSKGVRVNLTKQTETQMVRNKDRALKANRIHADLLVRLHCDAARGSGFTVYYPDRQGTQHGVTGPSRTLLAKIAPIAKSFHSVLRQDLRGLLRDNGLKPDIKTHSGAQYGAMIGSIYSTVPVVLVEMCVLTNWHDEALVSSPEGQNRLSESLADACLKSLEKKE